MTNTLAEKIEMLPSLKVTVDAYGLMAKKALGQNFLLDSNITNKIIKLSLEKQNLKDYHGIYTYEVGPGPGGLTRAILSQSPEKLTVVEMDERCINIMEDIKAKVEEKLEIINGDALQEDFTNKDKAPRHIISNLPYNISVPLLVKWLKDIKHFQSLTLMFQKEVAERIMAKTETKDYGRISILSQLSCKIEKLMDLNPNCFTPAPKIWSSVLLFTPLERKLTQEQISKIEKISSLAFGQRRKMLRQSLKTISNIEEILEKLNIPSTLRAENLTPKQYLELANNI